MIKKGLFLSVFPLLFSFFLNSQPFSAVFLEDKPFVPLAKINQSLLNQLEESAVFLNSSKLEKDFIYWTNFARLYPKSFCDSVLIPFLKEQPATQGDEAKQLIVDLSKAEKLPILFPDILVTNTSKDHALDLSKRKGEISHQSSNGRSFSQRMKNAGVVACAAENISLGQEDQLIALLLLYLDIGLTDAGHRKNLMNPRFTKMGVSVQKLKSTNQYITVQDFRCPQ
jgi:Cysteine-rich secretory protein family